MDSIHVAYTAFVTVILQTNINPVCALHIHRNHDGAPCIENILGLFATRNSYSNGSAVALVS